MRFWGQAPPAGRLERSLGDGTNGTPAAEEGFRIDGRAVLARLQSVRLRARKRHPVAGRNPEGHGAGVSSGVRTGQDRSSRQPRPILRGTAGGAPSTARGTRGRAGAAVPRRHGRGGGVGIRARCRGRRRAKPITPPGCSSRRWQKRPSRSKPGGSGCDRACSWTNSSTLELRPRTAITPEEVAAYYHEHYRGKAAGRDSDERFSPTAANHRGRPRAAQARSRPSAPGWTG